MADHRFKVEKGLYVAGSNNVIDQQLLVNGNTTVNASLLLVNGNFTVTGNYVVQGSSIQDVNIYPTSNGQLNVGSPTNTYNFYAMYLSANQAMPAVSGANFGNASLRWLTYSTNIDATGSIASNGSITVTPNSTATAFVADAINLRASINTTSTAGYALSVSGNGSFTGALAANGLTFGSIGAANGLQANTTAIITGNSSVNTQITPAAIVLGKTAFYQNNATVTTTTATTVDAFPMALSRSAKLVVSVDNSTGSPSQMHMIEMLVIHDNTTNVLVSKYGELYNTKLGTFDAVISGSNVNITFTATTANTYTVKTSRQQILI